MRPDHIFTRENMKDYRVVSRYRGGLSAHIASKRRAHDVTYKGRVVKTCSTLAEVKQVIKDMVRSGHDQSKCNLSRREEV
jgi:hypothetical protein